MSGRLVRQRVDDDVAALAVDRRDQTFGADRGRQASRERRCRRAALEQRRADDRVGRAAGDDASAARSTDRMPPPTRQGSAAQIRVDQIVVVPLVLRRVEIDQLHLGPAGEPRDPFVDGVALERQAFALDELHDAAAHEVD